MHSNSLLCDEKLRNGNLKLTTLTEENVTGNQTNKWEITLSSVRRTRWPQITTSNKEN
jgi:hypothetical protein